MTAQQKINRFKRTGRVWVTHEIPFAHLNIPPKAPTCSSGTQYVSKMAKSTGTAKRSPLFMSRKWRDE